MKFRTGFTLVEIMIVVAIIAIIASIAIPNLVRAQQMARDAKRIADLKQIRNALELFFSDNGYYPQSDCGWDCNDYRYSYNSTSWNMLAAELAPYIAKLPVDPINSGVSWDTSSYGYTYGNVGRNVHRAKL